jgi:hypothetical protein
MEGAEGLRELRSMRSFLRRALICFKVWEVSSSCFVRHKLASVKVATMPLSTAVAVARLEKASMAAPAKLSSAVCATAALVYPEAAAFSPCICLCWR